MVLNVDMKEKEVLAQAMRECVKNGFFSGKKAEALIKKIERSERKIKPRSAKNKGASWQKEMCEMISRITGVEFNQQDDSCDIHSREMGLSGADIIVRGRARELFDFDPECKNCNVVSVPEWIRQAKSNSKDGKYVIFVKSPRLEDSVAIMSIDNFESLAYGAAAWDKETGV